MTEGLAARDGAYDLYFGGRAGANEGIPWSDIVGKDWLMENNIGIAYGAVIENAIGGHGNDQINGNRATNQLTGSAGSFTFIIVDDTGTTLDGRATMIRGRHHHRFRPYGRDKIDLTELVVLDHLSVSYSATRQIR